MTTIINGVSEILGHDLRRLHVREYHRMIEAGVFDEDERVELLEGVIVSVSPQNPFHALVVERLSDPAVVSLPPQFVIRCQLPLTLGDADEPEPDIAVIDRDTPRSRRNQPATARVVFEVASVSLRKDREIKAALYARAGIPEYVIVNLNDESLEVHREPDPDTARYRSRVVLAKSDTFTSTTAAGLHFEIAAIFA